MTNKKNSLGSDIANVGKKFFNAIKGKTSFSEIVKTVSYNDFNQNRIEDKLPDLNGEKSHIYMGKIHEEEEEGIYSDDFLKGILQYYFYCTPKTEKVTLELANCVSEVLGENMKGFMNFEKQKDYILNFMKENFPKKQAKRLEVIDIETRHPRLFSGLRAYEKIIKQEASIMGLSYDELEKVPSFDKLNFLESEITPPPLLERNKNIDSLDIAKYLHYLCKSNSIFFDKIKAIKPERAKSDWYPIIEIALRMTDLLNGVRIQGGAMKQKNYDAIIREIVNPYINISSYPELGALRDFCRERLGDEFETLYIDTKKYRAHTNKIHNEKESNSKTRMATYITSAALISALGTSQFFNYQAKKHTQKQMQATINEIFENVQEFGDMGSVVYEGEEKIKKIEEYTQRIYERFAFRYGETKNIGEESFKAKIVDCLNNKEVLSILAHYTEGFGTSNIDRIIDEYLIPQNIGEFKINNIATIPYQRFLPYVNEFINTILLEKDFETSRDEKYQTMGAAGYHGIGNASVPMVRDIGEFIAKEGSYFGSEKYRFATTKNHQGGGEYIVATAPYRGDFEEQKKKDNRLSTLRAKELAIDFLKQTQPIINEVVDQYLLRYSTRDNTRVITSYGPEKNKIAWGIRNLLIKDFLRKGLLKKIQKKETSKIVNYLDAFVIENQDTLSKLTGTINKNMLPNGFLQEYEKAMQNTLKDKDKVFKENAYLPVTNRSEKPNIVNHIGRYKGSDGKLYFVGNVEIEGKQYLYAEQEGSINFGNKNYGYYFGEIVAKDYFKVKSEFLQKKALLEKKLKSASQTHKDIPISTDNSKGSTYTSKPKQNIHR